MIQDYGFIIPTCVRTQDNLDTLQRCIKSIRKFHSQKIVIIKDFTSTFDIENIIKEDDIIVEYDTLEIPASILVFYYFLKRSYFRKCIYINDNMEVLKKFENIENIYANYIRCYRNNYNDILEPPTEYNNLHNIKTQTDLMIHFINNHVKDSIRQDILDIFKHKHTWDLCVGCYGIYDYDFIDKLNTKLDMLPTLSNITKKSLLNLRDSLFSIFCRYLLNKPLEVYDEKCEYVFRQPIHIK